jgi:hypothetical protein
MQLPKANQTREEPGDGTQAILVQIKTLKIEKSADRHGKLGKPVTLQIELPQLSKLREGLR